jgi:hypothetical protein
MFRDPVHEGWLYDRITTARDKGEEREEEEVEEEDWGLEAVWEIPIRAVALGGGPGAELGALNRWLEDSLFLGEDEDLNFSGTVVDRSGQWRPIVESQGYGFVQMDYTDVVNPGASAMWVVHRRKPLP